MVSVVNTTKFMQQVDQAGDLADLSTKQVTELLDRVEVMKVADAEEAQERCLVFGALRTELSRRYDDEIKAMDSAALVASLAPIADLRTHRSESTGVLYDLYMYALTTRHPEALAAESAWADDTGEDTDEFEAGPAGPVIVAVRAVLGQ